MKAISIMSLVCAFLSLLAIFVLSAMTIVPGPGAERWRGQMMLVAAAFAVGWLCVAFWMRPRQNPALPPRWLRGLLVFVGTAYTLGIFFCMLG